MFFYTAIRLSCRTTGGAGGPSTLVALGGEKAAEVEGESGDELLLPVRFEWLPLGERERAPLLWSCLLKYLPALMRMPASI